MTPYSILSDNEMLFKYVPVGALASGALLSVPVWLYSLPTVPVPGWIGMNTTLGFHTPPVNIVLTCFPLVQLLM